MKKYDNYGVFSYSQIPEYQSQQTLNYLNLNNWYGLEDQMQGFIDDNGAKSLIKNNNKDWKLTK